jgi:ubiquinone biosynthesis protein Coq4
MIENLRFVRAFFAAVKEPKRTDEIFNTVNNKNVANVEAFKPVGDQLKKVSTVQKIIDGRFTKDWKISDLEKLPRNTLGYAYAQHMISNHLNPNFYPAMEGDTDLAYVVTRMRKCHDIWHTMTGFDISTAGEAGLHAFIQAQIPGRSAALIVSILILHCTLYNQPLLPGVFDAVTKGWRMGRQAKALLGEKFEENWALDLEEYRQSLNVNLAM